MPSSGNFYKQFKEFCTESTCRTRPHKRESSGGGFLKTPVAFFFQLNVLDLSYNGIADCCALASALHKIQALYLSHCEISTTCLQAIQSATRRKDVVSG